MSLARLDLLLVYLGEPVLERHNLSLFDKQVFFVKIFDDEVVAVSVVDIDEHGFDGRIAPDQDTYTACELQPHRS